MNILFVNCKFRMFDGIDSGAANRSTLFVKALSLIGHVDVISFFDAPLVSNIENCKVVYSQGGNEGDSIPSKKSLGKLIGWFYLLCDSRNPYTYYGLEKGWEAIVDEQIKKIHYDYVACRYIDDATRCGLLKYKDKLIVDVDDNPVNALKRDLTNKTFKNKRERWKKMLEIHLLGGMVSHLLSTVKHSFYSNILEPPSPNSVYLHNATAIKKRIPDITEETPMRMLIVGWLDYFPNKNGALHFVERIFPRIKMEIPQAELHIVGKCKDIELINKFNQTDGVKALGFVENVIEEYQKSRVVIVPVYQGAGTSVKFVEGLMMNRPVVSTPMGVRGFEHICHTDVHYMLATNDEEFVDKIVLLFNSIETSKKMALDAFNVGRQYLSQDRFFKILSDEVF